MKRQLIFVLKMAMLLWVPLCPSQAAAEIVVGLYPEPRESWCSLPWWSQSGIDTIFVVITSDEPMELTGVRFQARLDSCLDGFLYAFDLPWVLPATQVVDGESAEGISIGFGECLETPIAALAILVIWDPLPEGCGFEIVPDPEEPIGDIVVTDCGFNPLPAKGRALVSGPCVTRLGEPTNLYPPDGATGVSVDVMLDWDPIDFPIVCDTYVGCVLTHDLWFGTNPDPPWFSPDARPPYQLLFPLQPNTTYYWRVGSRSLGYKFDFGQSATISFTTEGPTPTKRTSWGLIKSRHLEVDDKDK